MSRNLPPALGAAIAEPVVRPFLAVRIELPDPVTVWTGTGTIAFEDSDGDARQWTGAGPLLYSIDQVGEQTDGSASGLKVSLHQVPADFADDIADQAAKGVLFEVYVGTLNEAMQSVEAVKLIFKGRLDEYRITDAGETLSVEITGESRAIDQRRPAIKKFSDEYQQRQFPGDLMFQYLPRMAEVSVLWANAADQGGAVGGGGGNGGFADRALGQAVRML